MLGLNETADLASPQDLRSTASGKLFFAAFVGCLTIFASASMYFIPHILAGDGIGYAHAIKVYQGVIELDVPPGLEVYTLDIVTAHRILTTALGVKAVQIFSELFGSVIVGWLVWDVILYFAISIVFYGLLLRIFQSSRVAFVGGLFFAGNFAMVTSGLGFFMDMGGWFFYVLSLYWLFVYIESDKYRDLFFSALAIALGGFFKENAFLAVIPLTAIVAYENFPSPVRFLKKIVPLGLLIAVPTAIHHVLVYMQYGYTYLYWTQLTPPVYPSRIAEYIKSLGSLLTFLAPLSLAGLYLSARMSDKFAGDIKKKLFLFAVVISGLPVLLWPGITQRVLFMVVPGCVLLACVFIQRYEQRWYAFLPIIVLYVLGSFYMDSFILDAVNLPF